jgi:hypothetical protein
MFKIIVLCVNTMLLLYLVLHRNTGNTVTMDPIAQQIHAIDVAFPLSDSSSADKKAELIRQILNN